MECLESFRFDFTGHGQQISIYISQLVVDLPVADCGTSIETEKPCVKRIR